MKLQTIIILTITMATALFSRGKEQYVVANASYLALYENRDRNPNETAASRVTNSDLLEVIRERDNSLLVETTDGKRGWVKRWLVKPLVISEESFAAQSVVASSGSEPAVILAFDEANETPAIVPERSFKEALRNNISKENSTLQ